MKRMTKDADTDDMEKDEDKLTGLDKPANPMGEDLGILESDK